MPVAHSKRARRINTNFRRGFHKSLELFNAHRLFKHTWLDHREDLVIVVEGFFDCMKLWQAGYPAVASMGSSLSDAQAEIIRTHWFEAVLLFDGDDAGRKCTDHALAKLGRHMWVRAALLDEGVQPDQLAPAQIQETIDSVL